MSKWRVVKDGDNYYPQKRKFGLWFNVVDEGYYEYTILFNSLEKALEYIEKQKLKIQSKVVWRE